ncbi:hypothetical protein ACSBR2_025870 [Camellia fascicularis]
MTDSLLPLSTQDRFELCEGSDENEDISNRCLLGKILASKSLNQQAVSNILSDAWRPRAKLEISSRSENRMEMDVTKPLPLGFFLQYKSSYGSEQMETWVHYKYEKLADFCYDCGRIGHVNSMCKFISREEGKNSPYGPDLRTSRAPRLNMPLEQFKHWVDEAEMRVQALSQERSAVVRRVDLGGAEVGAPHSTVAPNVVVHDVWDIPLGVSIGPIDEEVVGPGGRAVLSNLHIEGGKVATIESTIPGVALGATGEATETGPNLSSSSIVGPRPSYFVMEPSDQLIPLVEAQQTLDQFEPLFEIGIEEIRVNSPIQLDMLAPKVDRCMARIFQDLSIKRKA